MQYKVLICTPSYYDYLLLLAAVMVVVEILCFAVATVSKKSK